MQKEFRSFNISCRKQEGKTEKSYIVEGYAATFNQEYEITDFSDYRILERIDQDAFNGCQMDDVIFQYNHEGRVFARTTNNTLKIEIDQKGLKVIADLSGTEGGRKLYDDIDGGYINKMSFSFIIAEADMEERINIKDGKKEFVNVIKRIKHLYDVSAVSIPANNFTEISARNLAEKIQKRIEAGETFKKNTKNDTAPEVDRERLALEISFSL